VGVEEARRMTGGEIVEKNEDRKREREREKEKRKRQWLTAPCVCCVVSQQPPPPPPPPRVDFALSRSIGVRPRLLASAARSPHRHLAVMGDCWVYAKKKTGEREREREKREGENRPEEQRSRRALGFLWL
jgi:hypothetical protein